MRQILSNTRHRLISEHGCREQTCMELLPSWERMEDGGQRAVGGGYGKEMKEKMKGNRDRERGRDRQEEEETSEWAVWVGADGKRIRRADKDAEEAEVGLQHSGLATPLVEGCKTPNTIHAGRTWILFQHLPSNVFALPVRVVSVCESARADIFLLSLFFPPHPAPTACLGCAVRLHGGGKGAYLSPDT